MNYTYQGVCLSDIQEISDIVNKIINDLRESVEEETLLEIRLILNELLINAVCHGNKKDFLKRIRISVKIIKKTIEIKVQDEGVGINRPPCQRIENLCTSGRGLTLVESLSKKMTIEKNQIIVYKTLSP